MQFMIYDHIGAAATLAKIGIEIKHNDDYCDLGEHDLSELTKFLLRLLNKNLIAKVYVTRNRVEIFVGL